MLELPPSEILPPKNRSVSFTIVIPFRNEAAHIPKLIASLNTLKFPKKDFEILFVNDESTDASVKLISSSIDSSISFRVLGNVLKTNSPKKDAITLAISQAKGTWILTTDADCEVPSLWLSEYSKAIAIFDAKMLCAPVMITPKDSLTNKYQQADILSLQGVTMGSFSTGNPLLCNGANLAFEKEAFYKVKGYEGNDHLASGDDIFMLQKMNTQFPDKVYFIKSKDATVLTQAVTSWSAIIKQRIRWASKTSKVKNTQAIALGLLVFAVNLLWISFILLSILGLIQWYKMLVFILLKVASDALFIEKIKSWTESKILFSTILLSGGIYPFITCIVTFKSIFTKYTWKGRNY